MNNVWLITKYTIKEALAKRVIWVFSGISTFILLVTAAIFFSTDAETLVQKFNMGATIDSTTIHAFMKDLAIQIKTMVAGPLYTLGLFLSIFSVSSIIPTLLEKGNIDLFLSKPVSRAQLLLGKFTGGTIIIFANILYLVLGIYLLVGFELSEWDPAFLLVTFLITFAFMALYSIVILTGILTRSSILAMMISYLIIVISPVLASRGGFNSFLSEFWSFVLDIAYYILPQISNIGESTIALTQEFYIESYEPFLFTTLFTILNIALSIFIFNKKDY